MKRSEEFASYLLRSNDGKGSRTYVGSTNCFSRRIRQHNGEISGGARATKPACRRPWAPALIVHGFESLRDARSFEWHWKHPPKGLFKRGSRPKDSVKRRIKQGIKLAKRKDLKWRFAA